MKDININANGDILYHDQKGYEDNFRKHHQSPITRDIWLYRQGKFSRLTNFKVRTAHQCGVLTENHTII